MGAAAATGADIIGAIIACAGRLADFQTEVISSRRNSWMSLSTNSKRMQLFVIQLHGHPFSRPR